MRKNWRPVAILCSEYKLIAKCLTNRLNKVLYTIIHTDQSYCIKDRCISDNLHLVHDVIDYAFKNNIDMGLLSLDQEKAFDRASTARVNWDKSDALWCGSDSSSPRLPGRLQWGFSGFPTLWKGCKLGWSSLFPSEKSGQHGARPSPFTYGY